MPQPLPEDHFSTIWQNQSVEQFPIALDQLRRKTSAFQTCIHRRNRREYLAIAIVVAVNLVGLFAADMHTKPASALGILGALIVGWQLYKRASNRPAPETLVPAACLEFHLSELQRQLDLLRSVWKWYLGPLVPAAVATVIGSALHGRRGLAPAALLALVFTVTFVAVHLLNLRAARKLALEIESLKKLL